MAIDLYTITASINSGIVTLTSNDYPRWYIDSPATGGTYNSATGSGVSGWAIVFVTMSATGGGATSGSTTATNKWALTSIKGIAMTRVDAGIEYKHPLG